MGCQHCFGAPDVEDGNSASLGQIKRNDPVVQIYDVNDTQESQDFLYPGRSDSPTNIGAKNKKKKKNKISHVSNSFVQTKEDAKLQMEKTRKDVGDPYS